MYKVMHWILIPNSVIIVAYEYFGRWGLIRLISGKLQIKANKLTNTLRMAEYTNKKLKVLQLNY